MNRAYSLILVGSGFGSTFFLHRFLARAGPGSRVLVLERGDVRSHAWHHDNQKQLLSESRDSIVNTTPKKPWVFGLGFGGGSNSWWACVPRFLPDDFRMRSRYGVGQDWPLSYDMLDPYYGAAEAIMEVAGPADGAPYPMSRPYPQPPHRFSDPDRLFKQRFPEQFFSQPTARPTRATASRPMCCAAGACQQCPIDSKFTILNELKSVYADPRVTLVTGATVLSLDLAGSTVTGVRYRQNAAEHVAAGDLVGLGANALFNPHIMLRSGLADRELGRGLTEQRSVRVSVKLAGVNNYQGSTSITGLGYMLYNGDHRGRHAGALMESWNVPELRDERGKWRQRLSLRFIFEDLRQAANRVTFNTADPDRPHISFAGHSSYLQRGVRALDSNLPGVLDAIPVEDYTISDNVSDTEAHILGTTPMGRDAESSVVDGDLIHHRVRNLLVLGGSVFPTISPANPTLTICALALRAADRLTGAA